MEVSGSSLPPDHSEADSLALNHGGPEREEGELSEHSSSPDTLDQDDILGCDTYLNGGLVSDTSNAPGRIDDFQSKEMDTTAQPSGAVSCSDWPRESQDVRYARSGPDSNWGEGENEMAKRRRLYPKVRPFVIPIQSRIDNDWYQEEDMMDSRDVAPPACRVGHPNVNGSIGGDKEKPLPPQRSGRQYYYNGRELRRQITYSRAAKDEKGKYPQITEQEHLASAERQDTDCKSDAYWIDQLAQHHYFPTPEQSPVNFSYRVKKTTYAVPYHVVGPMAWEYPYHSGQAQEDLSDRLVPASLYGLKVTRPGYCSADAKPATATEALAAFESGKGFVDHVCDTDVNAHAISVEQVGQGHLGAALYVCTQPECQVAGGHELLFATLEQWAADWNTFHVAVAPVFNCMVRGCSIKTATAPDSLDVLFRHFQDTHPNVYDGGKWHNLVDLVTRGLHVKPNAHY